MEAINNSEIALQEIVTVRDKIVAAYLDILKMPL
jgi:flagellar hook-basal body complex protein FliE